MHLPITKKFTTQVEREISMKKLMFVSVLGLLLLNLSGCQTWKNWTEKPNPEKLVVLGNSTFSKELSKGYFTQGGKYHTEDPLTKGKTYLTLTAKTKDGKGCQVFRTEVIPIDGAMFMRLNGKGESCTGKNCSHCAFKKTGGCECKNSLNICEHTITRNSAVLARR